MDVEELIKKKKFGKMRQQMMNGKWKISITLEKDLKVGNLKALKSLISIKLKMGSHY